MNDIYNDRIHSSPTTDFCVVDDYVGQCFWTMHKDPFSKSRIQIHSAKSKVTDYTYGSVERSRPNSYRFRPFYLLI